MSFGSGPLIYPMQHPPDRHARQDLSQDRCREGPLTHLSSQMIHSSPFVLGSISRIRSSLLQAPRIARANALKLASIL